MCSRAKLSHWTLGPIGTRRILKLFFDFLNPSVILLKVASSLWHLSKGANFRFFEYLNGIQDLIHVQQ